MFGVKRVYIGGWKGVGYGRGGNGRGTGVKRTGDMGGVKREGGLELRGLGLERVGYWIMKRR